MEIKQMMTKQVETISPDATLQQAAEKIKSNDVGMLPVTDNSHLMGAITDRDIVVRASAKGVDMKSTRVREAMTNNVVTAFDDQDVQDAAKIMEDHKIRRLPVINHDQQLVGIIALADLSKIDDKSVSGEVLSQVTVPEHNKKESASGILDSVKATVKNWLPKSK